MNKKSIIIISLAFCSLLFVSPGKLSSQWIQTAGPWQTSCLLTINEDIYAGTANSYIYKSTDGGVNWFQINNGLTVPWIYALALTDNVIIAATGNGVFRSYDYGNTWSSCGLSGLIVFDLAVNGDDLFAGTYPSGVQRSTDNGTTWSNLQGPHWFVTTLVVKDNVIFAGTNNGGLFRSTNRGDNWSQCFPLPWAHIRSIAAGSNAVFAGTDYGGGVFKSTNLGLQWTLSGLANEYTEALMTLGHNVFAGTVDRGVYLSTDDGLTWQDWNQGIGIAPEILSFQVLDDYIFCGAFSRPLSKRDRFQIAGYYCGPGPHFVDYCTARTDSLDIAHNCETKALIRFSPDTSDNCNVPSVMLPVFAGPTVVRRSDPKDTSGRFPGIAQFDGHNDIIETEMLEMEMRTFVESNGDTAFLKIVAGEGRGTGPCGSALKASYGYIHELPAYNYNAESFFDVFIELCIEDPHGIIGPPNPRYYLYNLVPVGMKATIDQIPPKCGRDPNTNEYYTVYTPDPNTCSKLYASCLPGTGNPPLAKIVHVEHALPVELASFTALTIGNDIALHWTTSEEINNSGFAIERSSGRKWIEIGFVAGKGNSAMVQGYEFTDKNLASGIYNYRLKQIDFNGSYEYFELSEAVTIGVPNRFFVDQNYPNPFNPLTAIAYGIPQSGNVALKIFDMAGREVKTLVNEHKEAGYYVVKFDGSSLASGTYIYRIESGSFVSAKKMVLLK